MEEAEALCSRIGIMVWTSAMTVVAMRIWLESSDFSSFCLLFSPFVGTFGNWTLKVGGRLRCLGSNQRLKARFGQGYQLEVICLGWSPLWNMCKALLLLLYFYSLFIPWCTHMLWQVRLHDPEDLKGFILKHKQLAWEAFRGLFSTAVSLVWDRCPLDEQAPAHSLSSFWLSLCQTRVRARTYRWNITQCAVHRHESLGCYVQCF